MRIKIVAEKCHFTIPLPTVLVINGFTLRIISAYISRHPEIDISDQQLYLLFSQLNTAKKILNGRPLVDVKSKDGDIVHITL